MCELESEIIIDCLQIFVKIRYFIGISVKPRKIILIFDVCVECGFLREEIEDFLKGFLFLHFRQRVWGAYFLGH